MNHLFYKKKWNRIGIPYIPYNHIQFVKSIGEGASAEIWDVMIKEKSYSTKEYFQYEEDDMDDFDYELQNCNRLIGVKGVIQLYGYSYKGTDRYFLIFKPINCIGDLFYYIRQSCFWKDESKSINCMTTSLKKKIIISLINSIQNIHSKQMVHCDLKPENLVIGNGDITIIDLGASQYMMNQIFIDGSDKWIRGTPGYMAPEIEKKQIYYESDIYSLGVIIVDIWSKINWGETYSFNGCRKRVFRSLNTIQEPHIKYIASECISLDHTKRPSLDTILSKILL